MNITVKSLNDKLKALRVQEAQGLSLAHQAQGAIQLCEHLIEELNKSEETLTLDELGQKLGGVTVEQPQPIIEGDSDANSNN